MYGRSTSFYARARITEAATLRSRTTSMRVRTGSCGIVSRETHKNDYRFIFFTANIRRYSRLKRLLYVLARGHQLIAFGIRGPHRSAINPSAVPRDLLVWNLYYSSTRKRQLRRAKCVYITRHYWVGDHFYSISIGFANQTWRGVAAVLLYTTRTKQYTF